MRRGRAITLALMVGALTTLTPALTTAVSATVPPAEPDQPADPTVPPPPDATATSVAPPAAVEQAVPAPEETAPAQPAAVPDVTVPAVGTYPGMTPIPSNIQLVDPPATPVQAVGSKSGPATAVLQERLNQVGFWAGEADGKYGIATSQAVMAVQKYLGLKRTGKADQAVADWLNTTQGKVTGVSNTGTLIEIDKARQLLFLIVDGKTQWAFNTSTGSGKAYTTVNKKDPTKIETGDAQTPNGMYRTTRERPEGWWEGDLGKIYRPKYFVGGIAVHGMTSIPAYPASHGCVRLSVPAMDFLWDLGTLPVGTPVWVHS